MSDTPKIMPTEKRTSPPTSDETASPSAKRYYVSYAWADESDPLREAQVDKLCEAAEEKGIKIYRDKTTLGHGDLISNFMKQIGEGARVFIFLSDKYLRSAYCMFELFEMWRNSRQNKVGFMSRVRFFTIDKARIGTPSEWLEYTQYWKKERDDLRTAIEDVGWEIAGDETIKRYKLMESFTGQISDVLALFADVVQARTFDDFLRYGFEDPPQGSAQVKVGARAPKRTYVIGSVILISIVAICIATGTAWYFWPHSVIIPISTENKPQSVTDTPSLLDLYAASFSNSDFRFDGFEDINEPEAIGRVNYTLLGNISSRTKFIIYYVPHSQFTLGLIKILASQSIGIVNAVDGTISLQTSNLLDSSSVMLKDFVFSGAVYIFYEDDILSQDQIASVTSEFLPVSLQSLRRAASLYNCDLRSTELEHGTR
jgi:hypothetical protein